MKGSRMPATLCNVTLDGRDIKNVDLRYVSFIDSRITNTMFNKVVLKGSRFERSKIVQSNFERVDMTNARFTGSIIEESYFYSTDLSNASFNDGSMRDTELSICNLQSANISLDKISNVQFTFSNLDELNYQPADGLPDLVTLLYAKNLHNMRYTESPVALGRLREALKKDGLRQLERQVTHAIKRSEVRALFEKDELYALLTELDPDLDLTHLQSSWLDKTEAGLNYVLFELTTAWGMKPSRAIMLIFGFMFIFTIPYLLIIRRESEDGIWRTWSSSRVRTDLGSDKAVKTSTGNLFQDLKIAFYFSVLSAFRLGWRDINVGNWITHLQRREYTFVATGWARTISGMQSLLSVYLVAIWALTYFGRPFE